MSENISPLNLIYSSTPVAVEGEVIHIGDGVMWLKQADGNEVSLGHNTSNDFCRIGHHVRAVTTGFTNNHSILKLHNLNTGVVTSFIDPVGSYKGTLGPILST